MTVLTLFLTVATLVSCSNHETTEDELTSVNSKTSKDQADEPIYGHQFYYASTEIEINRLKLQKTKLVAEFENGNKVVMEQIEKIQKDIKKLKRFNESLLFIKRPKGSKGPMPPKPCLIDDRSNCIPRQNLSPNTVIVLGEELIVTSVLIKNNKEESVDTSFQSIKDEYGQSALQLKTSLEGEGIMYTTLKSEAVGEITIPTPVVYE
ncbi:hypothetical protein HPE56_15830 [Maribacter sp. ANRC-HE7]|uniref:Uncharacterized protein n=1 Tax=Maribacter aquimaris TaxID=2737171 RepID=A0ABR7V5N6_9FLAO|nr:hypothetical protein [Maribacter aquimaris]MBD0779270.1 hypothetical protein [Maribacter aquimaris]